MLKPNLPQQNKLFLESLQIFLTFQVEIFLLERSRVN